MTTQTQHEGMRHYLIVTNFDSVTEFSSFWAEDEDHALEQLDNETEQYNASQYVTHIFVSDSHIENSTIDRLWPTDQVKDRIHDELWEDRVQFITNLKVGDQVYWENPDRGFSSGVYTIHEILTESGKIESEDDIIFIKNEAGSEAKVYVGEVND